MNVFADYHHGDLFYSLSLLFEKRLGMKLYRPIGLDWFHEGFWKIADPYPDPLDTARQYLDLSRANIQNPLRKEYFANFQGNPSGEKEEDVYYLWQKSHNFFHKGITLEKFRSMKFDYVIASIPAHIPAYKKLIRLYQPNAKLIFQMGNPVTLPGWSEAVDQAQNILASTAPFPRAKKNILFYDQEFDLEVFKYVDPNTSFNINSYVHNMQKRDLFNRYKKSLTEFQFHSYGAAMDEHLHGSHKVAEAMQKASWTWHYKPRGDGFGHVIHSTYASGRPAIIDASVYKNLSGGRLLTDLETCIDFSKRSFKESIELIRKWSRPDLHERMCRKSYERFKSVVNFDRDEMNVRKFLERAS